MLVTKVSCTLYSIHPPKRPVQELGQIDVKLTCSMGKGPGKSSSKTARSGHGRKNMSCPKDKLEFKFFSSPVILCKSMCVIILTKHRSKWIDIVQFPFLHFCGRQKGHCYIPRLFSQLNRDRHWFYSWSRDLD